MDSKVSLIVGSGCIIGEGPVWDEHSSKIFWVDLLGNSILCYSKEEKSTKSFNVGQNTGSIALRENGGLVAALQHGFYFIDFERNETEFIVDPEKEFPDNRFNDGKCDPLGNFWAGTMSKTLDSGYGEYAEDGALYCLDKKLNVTKKLENVIISNGIDWSPDMKRMYFIDTPRRGVFCFDYDINTGDIANKRMIISYGDGSKGLPDGMCVDSEGMLWIALWGGGCITRCDPNTGKILETVNIPVKHVTSCAFGGEEYLDLYITTAKIDTDLNKYPDAGGVFLYKSQVNGLPAKRFRG